MAKKKEFTIMMPFTGVAIRTVEAETEEEAIEKFHEEVTSSDFEQWECVEQIVKGNVFYGVRNEMDIVVEEYDENE